MDEGDDFKSIHYCSRKWLNCTLKELRSLSDAIDLNIDDDTLHLSLRGNLRKYILKNNTYSVVKNSVSQFQRQFDYANLITH